MFWLPLILGLFGGAIFGTTRGSGGDLEILGREQTFEEGATNREGGGMLENLGFGAGGMALMLILMSLGSQRNQAQGSSPLVVVVEDDD